MKWKEDNATQRLIVKYLSLSLRDVERVLQQGPQICVHAGCNCRGLWAQTHHEPLKILNIKDCMQILVDDWLVGLWNTEQINSLFCCLPKNIYN